MSNKPQLILDLGGVLITNLSPLFWRQLAEAGSVSYEELTSRYGEEVRQKLWAGHMAEEQFWSWVGTAVPMVGDDAAKALLRENLRPLPAFRYLGEWSEAADIHILSNHRKEWIEPILRDVGTSIQTVTVSSEVGYSKPDRNIFEAVRMRIPPDAAVFFVDDHPANLRQAQHYGWETLLADERGDWIGKVTDLLKTNV